MQVLRLLAHATPHCHIWNFEVGGPRLRDVVHYYSRTLKAGDHKDRRRGSHWHFKNYIIGIRHDLWRGC